MSSKTCANRGFTLVEIIVAMTVGGVVMLGARQLFEALAQSARVVTQYTATTAHEANAEQLVRELVRRVEVGLDLPPFDGTSVSVRFSTWCDVPGGWSERCTASLVPNTDSTGWLITELASQRDAAVLNLSLGGVRRFIYFDGLDEQRSWKAVWTPGRPLPLAIGIVRSDDTLVLRIGHRG